MNIVKRGLSGSLKWLFLILIMLTILLPIGWIMISAFKPEVQIIRYPPHYFATVFSLKNFQLLAF